MLAQKILLPSLLIRVLEPLCQEPGAETNINVFLITSLCGRHFNTWSFKSQGTLQESIIILILQKWKLRQKDAITCSKITQVACSIAGIQMQGWSLAPIVPLSHLIQPFGQKNICTFTFCTPHIDLGVSNLWTHRARCYSISRITITTSVLLRDL